MQGRSWMAALTLAAGLVPPASMTLAGEPQPATPAQAQDATAKPTPHTVKLDLWIAGLGTKGCEVEIKPGHPGCEFQSLTRHVAGNGKLSLELKDVATKNADRDCTFAITIREPGQPETTVYRGLRIAGEAGKRQILPCYLSSPSRIAKTATKTTKR